MAGFEDRILVVISAAAGGAITEINRVGTAAHDADTHANRLSQTMKGALVAGAAAFIGTGLVSYLGQAAGAYADAAKKAGDLAYATGGSVEEVSRLTTALHDAGIDADTAATMLSKFTAGATGKNVELLKELGVVLKDGKGGGKDYADGMVQAIDAIMKIGDQSDRAGKLNELFGKKGAQAFQDLIRAGVPLREAMQQIADIRVLDDEDTRKADEYDQAMDDLSASMEGVGNTIGRILVPLISDAVGAFTGLIDIMDEVPGEVYLVVGAVVALHVAMKSELVVGALSAIGTFVAQSATSFAILRMEMGLTAAASATMSRAISAALLANPVTAVLVALTAAFAAFRFAQQGIEDGAKSAAGSLEDLKDQGLSSADAIKQLASEMEGSRHAGLDFFAAFQAQGGWKYAGPIGLAVASLKSMNDALRDGGADAEEYQRQIQKVVDEQGAMAGKAADAAAKEKDLNDMLAEGVASNEELAAKIAETADAQHEKNVIDETAKGLMEAYASATWDAVAATESMFDAQHAAEGAQRDLTEAIKKYNEERSAENADAVVDKIWDLAEASTAAWAAEEQRYGRYPDQMQKDAHKLQALKDGIAQLPEGSAVAEEMMDEFSRTVAAWATANPTMIPVGWTIEDINTAIATVQAQLDDPNTKPELKPNLTADLTALTTLKSNIETGAAAEVPATVVADPAQAQKAVDDAVGDKEAKVNVALAGDDKVEERLNQLDDWRDVKLNLALAGDGAVEERLNELDDWRDVKFNLSLEGEDEVRRTLDALDDWRDIRFTVDLVGDEEVKRQLDALDDWRTVRINVETSGVSAARAAINSIQPQSAAQTINRIVMPEMPQPVNIVKVSVDGQDLRATIRDELMNVRRSDDLVAAMGTVA